MKNLTGLFALTAAVILASLVPTTASAAGSAKVTIPLTGAVIRTGSNIVVTSGTQALIHAPIYYYSISGTLAVSGTVSTGFPLSNLLNTSTIGLSEALDLTGSVGGKPVSSYLNGFVLDPSSRFPFSAVNKLAKGARVLRVGGVPVGTLYGSVRVAAGINQKGIAYADLTNLSYAFKAITGGGAVKLSGSQVAFAFTSGQVTIQTSPITTGSAQPDLSFITSTGLVGVDLTGTGNAGEQGSEWAGTYALKKGATATIVGVIRNSGTAADLYTLATTSTNSAFKEKVIFGGKDITAAVSGTAGYTFSKPLLSGSTATFVWKVANKNAATATGSDLSFTATSKGDPTRQDAIGVTVVGK